MEKVQSIAQDQETPPEVVRAGDITYRYVYGRSADCRQYNDTGQDYITFNQVPGGLIFALCDGVSQSFMGDLAARILGDALIEWLIDLPLESEPETVKESLLNCLTELAEKSGQKINSHLLPDTIPALVRTVLEEKRALGSESTFVCGRIDLPSPSTPAGSFIAAWMGDSRLRLWNPAGESWQKANGTLTASQRWSSRRGAVGGSPNILVAPLLDREGKNYNLAHYLAYSDGLAVLDKVDDVLSNSELEAIISRVTQSAQSDDISLFEVWLGAVPEKIDARESEEIKEPDEFVEQHPITDEETELANGKTVELPPGDEPARKAAAETPTSPLGKITGLLKFWKKDGGS
jgi:hypothetical protein